MPLVLVLLLLLVLVLLVLPLLLLLLLLSRMPLLLYVTRDCALPPAGLLCMW